MIKYELKDIIIFAYVAKLKSFTKAADALYISRSVASSRVKKLEHDVNIDLLVRTTREVSLTSDGVSFLKYCNPILRNINGLDIFIQNYKSEVSGKLIIVLPSYFGGYYIVPYLNEFLKKYPNLKVEVILTEDPVDIVEKIYDIQVRIQIPEEEDLQVAKLMDNRKVLCASAKYVAENGKPYTPKDLFNHNCIIFGENDIWRFKSKVDGEITTLSDMDGNIKCSNGEIIKLLVLSGVGIAVKSDADIKEEIADGTIVNLLEDYEVINRTQFYAVYPAYKYESPKIRAFISFFQEKLASLK